jgi:hypothetical protein
MNSSTKFHQHSHQRRHSNSGDDNDDRTASEISLEDSPQPLSRQKPRRPNLPPIPDLRFEQSYLKQLEAAKGSVMWMIVITIREQVLLPGLQGFLWALGMAGLRTLRSQQAENGKEWGSWLRDWWGRLRRTDTTTVMGGRSQTFNVRK